LEQNGQGSPALLSRWLLLKVLKVNFLNIPKVVGALGWQWTAPAASDGEVTRRKLGVDGGRLWGSSG
jgi:hypothetical protein